MGVMGSFIEHLRYVAVTRCEMMTMCTEVNFIALLSADLTQFNTH